MPFGLAMENREITDEPYRYRYQGQFSEKDITTGMQEFELRMYDPRIGRWISPDPYGQFVSPYVAMGNIPHMSFDPDGGFSEVPVRIMGFAAAMHASAHAISGVPMMLAAVTVTARSLGQGAILGGVGSIGLSLTRNTILKDGSHTWTSTGDCEMPQTSNGRVPMQSELDQWRLKYSPEYSFSNSDLHITGVKNVSGGAKASMANNPWINVASSANDILDLSTAIAMSQIAKQLKYWTKGARLGGEILGHSIGAVGWD